MQIRCSNCFYEYEEAFGLCPNCGYEEGEDYAEAYCLAPGTLIKDGRFAIGQTLGVGGFGITYKAWDTQLDTCLAIKEFFPFGLVNRTAGDPTIFLVANKRAEEFAREKKRFLEEARNMAKFSKHHNIVNVFNYFEENNTAYIVMEYLDGMTLSQTLEVKREPLPVERCVSITLDLCDALESIHNEDILHRDVSPDNIMLCTDGTVKLFDFGAARFSMDAAEDSLVTVVVKPGFAPPEQYNNVNKQDARTDLYALGATMYYALTGVKPEESTNRKEADSLVSPNTLNPEIPYYINNAILRLMAMEPQYRFKNVDELRKVLRQKIEVSGIDAERRKRLRRRLVSIGAAMLVIAAAFAAFWLSWKQQQIPAGSVEIWYMTTEDGAQAEAAVWQTVTDQFVADHPEVAVKAVGVPETVYVEKVAEAQKNGTLPDIYESTVLPAAMLHDAQPLTDLLSRSRDMYLDGLQDRNNQYPTGMVLPAIYVNYDMVNMWESASFSDMLAACSDIGSTLLVSPAAADMYAALYDTDMAAHTAEDALDQFVNGKCPIYLGTTSDFPEAQAVLENGNGRYNVLFPQTGEAVYAYGCLWSCSETDADTTRIAHALMKYMNTPVIQDHFNIRNFDQSKCMPVAEDAIAEYLKINEDLAGVSMYLELPYAQ